MDKRSSSFVTGLKVKANCTFSAKCSSGERGFPGRIPVDWGIETPSGGVMEGNFSVDGYVTPKTC